MLLAYLAFAIGVASPGPSVLAVMGMAMAQGRTRADAGADDTPAPPYAQLYLRGAAMHLTNPKAVVVWLSVVSLALPPGAGAADALAFVGTCVPISAAIFSCYALAFSTSPARRAYRAGERGIHALLAGVFGYAGLRMLLSSSIKTG